LGAVLPEQMGSCYELIESYLQQPYTTSENNAGKKREARESPAQAHYQPAKTRAGEINKLCKLRGKKHIWKLL